jgi:hypothetical protein
MTLLWRQSTEEKTFTNASLSCLRQIMDLRFRLSACVPVPQPFPECAVEIEKSRQLPDFVQAGQALIVSDKLRNLIEAFKVDAEYVSVTLVRRGSVQSKQPYYLLNPLASIDCFNYKKSEYTPGPAGVTGIGKLVIDEAKTVGRHLFRVGPIGWAHAPNPQAIADLFICVSEELARKAMSVGVTGVVFSPPERLREFPPPPWQG